MLTENYFLNCCMQQTDRLSWDMLDSFRWTDDCDWSGRGGKEGRCSWQAGLVIWSGHGYWPIPGGISHQVFQVQRWAKIKSTDGEVLVFFLWIPDKLIHFIEKISPVKQYTWYHYPMHVPQDKIKLSKTKITYDTDNLRSLKQLRKSSLMIKWQEITL